MSNPIMGMAYTLFGVGILLMAYGIGKTRLLYRQYKLEDPGCRFHGEEPVPEHYWMLCAECGHVYATYEDALGIDTNKCDQLNRYYDAGYWPSIEPIASEDDMTSCPLCGNDW